MRLSFSALVSSLSLTSAVAALTTKISVQPIHASDPPPTFLAEVEYDLAGFASASQVTAGIVGYEPPVLPDGSSLVRIGVYDAAAKRWASSTTTTSVENFDKGYAPAILLTATEGGIIIGASLRGVQLDAGASRDFGPRAQVALGAAGKEVELNKPVVLNPEGKKVVPEQEKTLLQKYWWVLGLVTLLLVTGGGGGDGK